MSIVLIDVQDGVNNLDVGVDERAIGRRFTQINAYFLLMSSNKCKSVFCVAPDYKKTPDLKKRLRQVYVQTRVFFLFPPFIYFRSHLYCNTRFEDEDAICRIKYQVTRINGEGRI